MTRDFLLGMVMGTAVGGAVALLLAPQRGSDTREAIRQGTEDVLGQVNDVTQRVKDRTGQLLAQTREHATDAVEPGQSKRRNRSSMVRMRPLRTRHVPWTSSGKP